MIASPFLINTLMYSICAVIKRSNHFIYVRIMLKLTVENQDSMHIAQHILTHTHMHTPTSLG